MHGQTELPVTRRPGEPDITLMSRPELAAWLLTKSVVSLWPTTGRALGLSRASTYRGARSGQIRCLKIGARYIVPARWLAQRLALEDEDQAR